MIADHDVFVLTTRGLAELRQGDTRRTPDELEILVLVDGRSTVEQIAASARNLAPGAVQELLGALRSDGLVQPVSKTPPADVIDAGDFFSINVPPHKHDPAGATMGREASRGVQTLRDQGYLVRIARRAETSHAPAPGHKPTVVMVDDDLVAGKLLRTYLTMEGFALRVATNREEIVAAFRQPPLPDLVLLDVTLPDADGFEVLFKLRHHPALKDVAVIMLTAMATREAVIKGIIGGANGYITKPFDIDILSKAVRAVLGMVPATGVGRATK